MASSAVKTMKTITIRLPEELHQRVKVKLVIVQSRQEFGGRKSSAVVARPRDPCQTQRLESHEECSIGEAREVRRR